MKGEKWVPEPNCIEVVNGTAKAYLFKVPGGYVVPVVFGQSGSTVSILIKNVPGLSKAKCEAICPGIESPSVPESSFTNGILKIRAPLIRGCAMVRISRSE